LHVLFLNKLIPEGMYSFGRLFFFILPQTIWS